MFFRLQRAANAAVSPLIKSKMMVMISVIILLGLLAAPFAAGVALDVHRAASSWSSTQVEVTQLSTMPLSDVHGKVRGIVQVNGTYYAVSDGANKSIPAWTNGKDTVFAEPGSKGTGLFALLGLLMSVLLIAIFLGVLNAAGIYRTKTSLIAACMRHSDDTIPASDLQKYLHATSSVAGTADAPLRVIAPLLRGRRWRLLIAPVRVKINSIEDAKIAERYSQPFIEGI
jgi:hypothetical protein